MNKINFTAKDNFPLSSDTMEMMQQMIGLSANMALLGGTNYILSGCVASGTNVSSGIIVINGELVPFEGGAKKAKITIQQTSKTLTAFGVEYPEAYIYRVAKFSDTGEYDWLGFSRVVTNREIEDRINGISGVPVGSIQMWAGNAGNIPNGYALCNGSFMSIGDYPELYAVVGGTYGISGNSFRIPDLQGKFVVGYNINREDYNQAGKTGGADFVSLTINQIPPHAHRVKAEGASGSGEGDRHRIADWTSDSVDIKTSETIGGGQLHENRPPYFVLAYIIKTK
jgi:microcystin-dependent protein